MKPKSSFPAAPIKQRLLYDLNGEEIKFASEARQLEAKIQHEKEVEYEAVQAQAQAQQKAPN